jgi:TonB-linked SusC/RagA family outer membrane protein
MKNFQVKCKENYLKIVFAGLFSILLLTNPMTVLSQTRTVTGKIIDNEGGPVIGATIVIVGTTNGTTSDIDGSFLLDNVPGNGVLRISYIGYATREIPVAGQSVIVVTMEEEAIGLEEVVAIGYGVQRKSDLTGAVVSVSREDLTRQPVNNVFEAMLGKVAGVDITSSQRPGELGSVRIRGTRSLKADNAPLYVVDGVPLMSSSGIESLNPQDIESIDILKDASSTAIYGSRGANGVILVTTRKGEEGKFTINYSGSVVHEQMDWRSTYMNAEEFIDFVRWGSYNKSPSDFLPGNTPSLENDSKIELFTADPIAWANFQKGWQGNSWNPANIERFDWMGSVTQPNITHEHTLNFSGGSKNMRTYASFGYLDNQGTVKGQGYKRFTLRGNIDLTPREWIRLGTSINGTRTVQEYGQSNTGASMNISTDLVLAAAKVYPYALPYDENGNKVPYPGGQSRVANVIDEWEYSTNERVMMRIMAALYAEIDLVKGLRYRMNFGPDYRSYRNGVYNDGKSITRGGSSYAGYSGNYNFSWTIDNLLYYDKIFGDHTFNATLLQTASEWKYESYNMTAQNIPTSEQKWYNMGSVTSLNSWGTGLTERQLASYMGRLNYNFQERFLLTLSGRWDGASQLADGNKWAFFPSAAVAWRMEQEDFIRSQAWIDQLKLRVGYGVTGNSAVDPYTTKGEIDQTQMPFGSSISTGYNTTWALSNLFLGWEKTSQYNIGLDFSFNKRISGVIDVYTSRTTDLIMTMALPSVSGYTSTLANVGETQNKGVDLVLNTVNIMNKDFRWETNINAAYQKNEIVKLMNGKEDMVADGWFIGESINVAYTYKRLGIWQDTPEDQAEMAKFNANGHKFTPGNVRVEDQNGDYRITANDDRVVIGNQSPRWTLGLGNNLRYKNWDLYIFISGRMNYITNVGDALTGMFGDQRVLSYWTPDNPGAEYQKPYRDEAGGDSYSNTYYRDNSYLKIKNISLGYTFPKSMISNLGVDRLRLYIQTRNPGMLWSNISFRDAEYNTLYNNRGFVFGVNIGF